MAISCGAKCAKYILFTFNVIFWIAGAGLLGVGIWFLVDTNALHYLHIATIDSTKGMVQPAAIILVVVGALMFITGGLGCCGAIREVPWMLTAYAAIMVIFLILQVTAGILGVVFKNKILNELDKSMTDTVQKRYGNGQENEDVTEAYDFMQAKLHCCGATTGPADWKNSHYTTNGTDHKIVPDTCCTLLDENAATPMPVNLTRCNQEAENIKNNGTTEYIWPEGCSPKMKTWIEDHAIILIGVAFGLAAIQIIGILISCLLKNDIQSGYQYV